MSRIITKRYPVINGDIDRAWLVDQLPRAKRPNVLLEIALHPLPVCRIALQAWLSVDTLIDFVLGDDDLTPLELHSLSKALALFDTGSGEEWMLGTELWINDDDEPAEVAKENLARLDPTHPATPLIGRLLNLDAIPYGAVHSSLLYNDLVGENLGDLYKPRSKRITRRRKKTA